MPRVGGAGRHRGEPAAAWGSPSACSTPPGGAVTVFICSLKCYLYCKETEKEADALQPSGSAGSAGSLAPWRGVWAAPLCVTGRRVQTGRARRSKGETRVPTGLSVSVCENGNPPTLALPHPRLRTRCISA